jgi:hypothetical protein
MTHISITRISVMKRFLPLMILLVVAGCAYWKSKCPVNETKPLEITPPQINSNTFIEIKMEGGGFYGGANPVSENTRLIKNDGTVVIRNKQLYTGGKERIFSIPRAGVEVLARFISDKGFFNMKTLYDCDQSNRECQERKRKYPPAVPLRLDVTIDQAGKQVTVSVYEKGMVNYPDEFELIVNRINELVAQAEQK